MCIFLVQLFHDVYGRCDMSIVWAAFGVLATTSVSVVAVYLAIKAHKLAKDIHHAEERRENLVTMRETYAYLYPRYVWFLSKISSNNEKIILKEFAPDTTLKHKVNYTLQFIMKVSRETVIKDVILSEFKIMVGKKMFTWSGNYEIKAETRLLPNDINVDHTVCFDVTLQSRDNFILPQKIDNVNVEISYINIFDIRVDCSHAFELQQHNKPASDLCYVPADEKMNTRIQDILMHTKAQPPC